MDGCDKPQPKTKRSLCRRSALRYSGLLQLAHGFLQLTAPIMEQSGVLCYILYRERSEDMKVTVEQITPERAEEVLLRCHDPKDPWVEEIRKEGTNNG